MAYRYLGYRRPSDYFRLGRSAYKVVASGFTSVAALYRQSPRFIQRAIKDEAYIQARDITRQGFSQARRKVGMPPIKFGNSSYTKRRRPYRSTYSRRSSYSRYSRKPRPSYRRRYRRY